MTFCIVPGCKTQRTHGGRLHVCAAHIHDAELCNCSACRSKRYRIKQTEDIKEPWTPGKPPWELTTN